MLFGVVRSYVTVLLFLAVAGCSNHPLVDDVTPYTTAEIFEKLRCEARTAILKELRRKRVYDLNKKVLAAKKDIDRYNEWRSANNTLLSEFDKRYDAYDERIKTVTAKKKQLEAMVEDLNRETVELVKQAGTFEEGSRDHIQLRDRALKIVERRRFIQSKAKALEDELKSIRTERTETENKYRASFEGIKTTLELYLKAKNYIDSLVETLRAQTPNPNVIAVEHSDRDWKQFEDLFAIIRPTLSMQLDFKVTENNNANLDGTVKWPIHLGSLSLLYKAGRDKARKAQRVVHITSTFEELTDDEVTQCPPEGLAPLDKRARAYPIVGRIGVDEFVQQWFAIVTKGRKLEIATGKDTFTDTLTFTTKIKGQLNPVIEIAPVSPSLVKGSLDLLADREDLHIVTLQVRPYASPKSDGDTKVQITKVPHVSVNINEGPGGYGSSIDIQQ